MSMTTKLLRQVHPSFMHNGAPSSQAFRPTPKDAQKLSCDNGDQISAKAAWERFTSEAREPETKSVGVQCVTKKECEDLALTVEFDATPYPEHVSIDFTGKSNNQCKTLSKKLRECAQAHGWQYKYDAEL